MWIPLVAVLVFLWVCIQEPRTIYWIAGTKAYVLWNYARYVAYAIMIMIIRDRTIVTNWDEFWKRYLYGDVKECWNRPVHSGPGRVITIAEREKSTATLPIIETGEMLDCINMGSYNYLGTGGGCISMNVFQMGNPPMDRWILQAKVEASTAQFLEKEYCVIVPTGYATNSSLIPCIIDSCEGEIVVLSDSLNHTSIVRGIQLRENRCKVGIFDHGDIDQLCGRYGNHLIDQNCTVLIIVEGLYSMEGDYAPLHKLIELKQKFNKVFLYVDEAHSIGALGETGKGICQHLNEDPCCVDFLMGTFTKSFASIGGYVTFQDKKLGERVEALYRKRFVKEVVPLHPACARQILDVIEWLSKGGQYNIKKLRKNSIYLRKKLKGIGCEILGMEDSPVIPIMIREVHHVESINRMFLKCGFAVVSVGYPATPLLEGCRLRFCVSATHTTNDLDVLVEVMDEAMEFFNMLRMPIHPDETSNQDKLVKELQQTSGKTEEQILISPREFPLVEEKVDRYRMQPWIEKPLGERAVKVLRLRGCGSCGPRGFYGTMDLHLELEKKLATFYEREDAAMYAHAQCVASSVIPHLVDALGGPDKVIIAIPEDWEPRYDMQLAFKLSKAELARIAKGYVNKNKLGPWLGKHLLIITPSYDSKIMVDRDMAFDHFGDVTWVVDEFEQPFGDTRKKKLPHVILGTFETREMGGMGGFCVGTSTLVEPQRLYAKSYVFSASLPPYLCQVAMDQMENLI
jgi:serine palmitoyltransferase